MRRTLSILKLLFLLTTFSQIFCINVSSEKKLNAEVEKKVERKTAQNIQEKSNAFNINNNGNKIKNFNEKEKVVEKEKKEKENNLFTLFALQQPPLEKNVKIKEIKNDVIKKQHFRDLQDSFISDDEIQNIQKSFACNFVENLIMMYVNYYADSSDNIENPLSSFQEDDFFANMFMDCREKFMDGDTGSFYDDYSVVNDDIYFYGSNLEDNDDMGDYDDKVDDISTVNLKIESNIENFYQENNEIDEKIEFGEIITENIMDTNCFTLNNAPSDEIELDRKEFSESQIGTPNHDFLPFISGKLHARIYCFI